MGWLVGASLLWACSFGLIKAHLGGLPPAWVALVRLALSLALFAPLLRPRAVSARLAAALGLTGAVQYGLMYVFYLWSFRYLTGAEVAVFTILTPVYVVLAHDVRVGRVHRTFLLAALLAVAGSGVIVAWQRDTWGTLAGFLLVQASNLCFAAGQLGYRVFMARAPDEAADWRVFGWVYLGAVAMAAAFLPFTGGAAWPAPTGTQWRVLLYLGLVPSGIGFFLWNVGARRVSAGTLAVMNNAKVPLAVFAAMLLFGERPALAPLLIGGAALFAAVWVCEHKGVTAAP